MRAYLCAVCIGIALVGTLPSLSWLVLLAPVVAIAGECFAGLKGRPAKQIRIFYLCVLLGLAWHGVWAKQRLHRVISPAIEGMDLLIDGRITSIPVDNDRGRRFEVEVIRSHSAQGPQAGSKLLLNTFRANSVGAESGQKPARDLPGHLQLGQVWQLVVRLKRPHGYGNVGGRDSEAELLRNNIAGTGYVRPSERNIQLEPELVPLSLVALRGVIWSWIEQKLQRFPQQGLMLALLMGEKSRISASDWELFSATGTNHLFVISGLHIGLVAFVAYGLLWRLLALIFGPRHSWPTQTTAALLAVNVAVFYCFLAGFSLPAQRACLMVVVFLLGIPLRLRVPLSLRYVLALTVVLLVDPLAVTSPGFWFSFSAVAVLILFTTPSENFESTVNAGRKLYMGMKAQLQAQGVVFIGLFVPLLAFLGQVSLIAPIVNLVAIPIVGLIIVPTLLVASLLSIFAEGLGDYVFVVADTLLQLLIVSLRTVSEMLDSAQLLIYGVNGVGLFCAALGCIVCLMPVAAQYRLLAVPLFLPLLMPETDKPAQGVLRINVFDVGQGLSVLLSTRNHVLLFDTGAGNDEGWSAAEFIVEPAIQHLGFRQLDRLVVSHSDNDHSGGLPFFHRNYPNTEIIGHELTDNPQCMAGDTWYWDDVRFEFLHPDGQYESSNNSSCVLRVEAGHHSVLLPGDIEAEVEWNLAQRLGAKLRSTILIAPHHGSSSSSSYPFIKMVDPSYVVFSAGYRNGFAHPAASVEERYDDWGVESFNTSISGMLSFELGKGRSVAKPEEYRGMHRKYWSWSGIHRSCRYC